MQLPRNTEECQQAAFHLLQKQARILIIPNIIMNADIITANLQEGGSAVTIHQNDVYNSPRIH